MYQFVKKVHTFGSDVSYTLHPSYNTLEEAEAFIRFISSNAKVNEALKYKQCKGITELQQSEQKCYFVKTYVLLPLSEHVEDTANFFKHLDNYATYYLFKLAD